MIHVGSLEWYKQKTRELDRERYLMRECTETGRMINRVTEMFERAIWGNIYEENIRERININARLAQDPRYVELMIDSPGGSI